MDLLQNHFHILTATPRDNRQRIMSLAEERSLMIDSNMCIQARSDLINPRKRLSSEIAWLPGIGPKRSAELLLLVESSPPDLLDIDKVTSVTRANLLAAGLSRLTDYSPEDITKWILEIAWAFDGIKSKELCVIINDERIVSGFPEVTDLSAIEMEIQERRRHYLQVVNSSLNNLSAKERIKALTAAVEAATDYGTKHGPILIDDLIDSFEVKAQAFFEKKEADIKALIEEIHAAADAESPGSTLVPMVNQLIQVVIDWDIVAQPIQISTKSRGLNHDASYRIFGLVRELAVHLFNKHDKLYYSQQLTNMLQKVFAEVIVAAECTAKDAEKLDEIAKERNLNDSNLNDLLYPILNLCKQAQENADKNPALSDREAQKVIDAAPRLIALMSSKGRVLDEVESKYKDNIALTIMNCAIIYGNKTEKWNSCIYFLNEALKYAWSNNVRNKIENNLSVVERNNRLYGNLSPINSAPSLSTINGIGGKLYGKTDIDPETNSYLSTYYFVLLFIPVFPICRYRVIPTENGYKFLGKVPLRVFDKWHIAIVSLALLALVVFNVNSGSNSKTTGQSGVHTLYDQPSVPSAPPAPQNNDNQSEQTVSGEGKTQDDYIAVGEYWCSRYHHNTVHSLKPDETEKQSIKAIEDRIDTEVDNIKSLGAEIDSYVVDHSSQSSINYYNSLVNDYNSRIKKNKINVADYDYRRSNYNAQVDKYNNYLRANCRPK